MSTCSRYLDNENKLVMYKLINSNNAGQPIYKSQMLYIDTENNNPRLRKYPIIDNAPITLVHNKCVYPLLTIPRNRKYMYVLSHT